MNSSSYKPSVLWYADAARIKRFPQKDASEARFVAGFHFSGSIPPEKFDWIESDRHSVMDG